MKKRLLCLFLLGFCFFTIKAQGISDDGQSFKVNDSIILTVGQDVIINKPDGYDFINVQEEKKKFGLKKLGGIANVGEIAGGALVGLGVNTGSIRTVMAGAKVATIANTASDVAMTKEAIDQLSASPEAKSIIGKRMRIMKFKVEGNKRRGIHEYAILAGEDKKDYRVEILPAVKSGEIIIYSNNSK